MYDIYKVSYYDTVNSCEWFHGGSKNTLKVRIKEKSSQRWRVIPNSAVRKHF